MKKTKNIAKTSSKAPKRKKVALGKGLDALIPGIDTGIDTIDETPRNFFECDIDQIFPNRFQPRERFSEQELEDLSRSIKEQGILQPLLVRNTGKGYELIAGERRLRASKLAGLKTVPVILKNVSDEGMLELSIVENIQRENLNAVEEAEAYHQLISRFKMTQEQAADRVGKSRSTVTNMLRLRSLPVEIKESIIEGDLTMGHARALLGAKNSPQQIAAWKMVISKGLSVRETEALIDRLKTEKKPKVPPRPGSDDIYFSSVAENLSRDFGTKVLIQRSGQKGKVVFEYYNNDDLDRLLNLWKNHLNED